MAAPTTVPPRTFSSEELTRAMVLFQSPSSRIIVEIPDLIKVDRANMDSVRPPMRKVAVAITGDPKGIPVLFNSGMGGGRFIGWLLHDYALKTGVKLICPDRPNVGISDPWDVGGQINMASSDTSQRYRGGFQLWADHLSLLLKALEIPKVGLMGMSCGCTYSLAFAERYPHMLLPAPIQLLACWIPPSIPECSTMVKAGTWLPTGLIVQIISSAGKTVMDPAASLGWGLGAILHDVGAMVKWMATLSTSLSTELGILKPPDTKDGTPSEDPMTFFKTIEHLVQKLEAVTYTLARNRALTPEQALEKTMDLLRPAPELAASVPVLP
ncbi:hypothetical protein HK101_009576, partial [Irineochytrium annulatum]